MPKYNFQKRRSCSIFHYKHQPVRCLVFWQFTSVGRPFIIRVPLLAFPQSGWKIGSRKFSYTIMMSGCIVFSVTRRSRSDVRERVSDWVGVCIDLTYVTLVSDDTFRRLYWCDPDDPDSPVSFDSFDSPVSRNTPVSLDSPDSPDSPISPVSKKWK